MDDDGLGLVDGVEAKRVVTAQLARVPARIATLGGEGGVSVAPLYTLARHYGDDLAIIWIDSHPDIGTPASGYRGSRRWRSPP